MLASLTTLASPTLTALSGQPATFLAGGEFPVPSGIADGQVSYTYKDFGVRLVFTPIVLDGDRIQIHLTPEVSGIGSFTTTGRGTPWIWN